MSSINDKPNLSYEDLKETALLRRNIIDFLDEENIKKLNQLFDGGFIVDQFTDYKSIVDQAIFLAESQKRWSQRAKKIFNILILNNHYKKIERYQYNKSTQEITEYSAATNEYIFLEKGTLKKFNALVLANGKFVAEIEPGSNELIANRIELQKLRLEKLEHELAESIANCLTEKGRKFARWYCESCAWDEFFGKNSECTVSKLIEIIDQNYLLKPYSLPICSQ